MRNGTADRVTFSQSAQAVLRILIASYFIAVALHLIPGTDLSLLFAAVLPPPYAGALAAGLVFILAFMVMMAHYTRAAALILGLMTFYASYLTMVEMGVAQELGAFWRDLALIAALLLTYSDGGPARTARRRFMLQRAVAPRRVAPILERVAAAGKRGVPEMPAAANLSGQDGKASDPVIDDLPMITPRRNPMPRALPAALRDVPLEPEIDNVFAEDTSPAAVFRAVQGRVQNA